MDPVVRYEDRGDDGMRWMLDSALHSDEDTILMCDIDCFDTWFFEGYSDNDYTPSVEDMRDFSRLLAE